MADGFITGYRDMEGACIAGMSVCVMSAVVSRARRTFRRLRRKSTSGHPLIPFWCKCAGMLAHCSFSIKRVTSRKIIIRFRQRANATSRLPTWMLTEQFKLLVSN